METAKDDISSSFGQREQQIDHYFNCLKSEVSSLLKNEAQLLETIHNLQNDLNVYKRAYADIDHERQELQRLKLDTDKQKEDLENQLKGHRVIALLDGDGAIFTDELIAQGQAGGHVAAQKLSDTILQYLACNYGPNQYQLWVYVFLNKRGLMDALGRAGLPFLKIKFEDFMMGFNQAAERFMMVDVGTAKEAADAKIKAHIEDDIRLPQTFKILFGGCHDNGYVPTLRSQITSGYKQKLILIPSYAEIVAGIAELELPTLICPGLFMSQKLGTHVPRKGSVSESVTKPSQVSCQPSIPPSQEPVKSEVPEAGIPSEVAPIVISDAVQPARPFASLPTYSSAVQVRRTPTPDLDSDGSSASSVFSDELPFPPNPRASPTFSRSRHINPNIPLSKHKPPPCTLFYLANCKYGTDCKYAHDYLLEAEHFEEIRINAKKAPCPSVNKDEICIWGEACCYGHVCPLATKCHFYKQGRCKFTGSEMHKEPKGQS